MKRKSGFTLIELLICITLLSVVIIFLFRLINDVRHESDSGAYIKEIYVARNEVMNKAGNVISKYGVCGVDTHLSTTDNAIVKLHICNGKTMNINVTSSTFKYSYDGDEYTIKAPDSTITFDPNFKLNNNTFINYEFYEINFPTHKKGIKDTVLDDIGIYYGIIRDYGSLVPLKVYDCLFDEQDECEITLDYDGTYILELWGGKGEAAVGVFNSTAARGGYGSYTYAEVRFNKGDVIHVGLAKGGKCYGNENPGWTGGNSDYGMNGGDAPFVAFHKIGTGYLNEYSNYKDEVIAAAGGGGGASKCDSFAGEYSFGGDHDLTIKYALSGHDAGYNNLSDSGGSDYGIYYAYSRAFGKGSNCDIEPNFCGGCGGGGYWGGAVGKQGWYYATSNLRPSGQGGRGYYNTAYVKNGIMYAYDQDPVTVNKSSGPVTYDEKDVNTYEDRTIHTKCVGFAQAKCANNGDPYVRITVPQHVEEEP